MAYTEFYVTKANNDDTNGGSSDGAPYSLVAGVAGATATDNGADSNIEDLNNGSWAGVAVDDWICFDTGGLKEFSCVTARDVGGDADIITVAPQVTAAAEKGCNANGSWEHIDHATSTVTATFVNAAGSPPRINVKYNAAAYTEAADVTFDNAGTLSAPITLEGYYSSAGDNCMNGVTWTPPELNVTVITNAMIYANNKHYIHVANCYLTSAANNERGIYLYSIYGSIRRVKVNMTGTGTTVAGMQMAGNGSHMNHNWIVDACGPGIRAYSNSVISNNYIASAQAAGVYITNERSSVTDNIIANYATHGIQVGQQSNEISGNTIFAGNTATGSGIFIDLLASTDPPYVANNLIWGGTNSDYGIEVQAADKYLGWAGWNGIGNFADADHDTLNILREEEMVHLTADPFTNAAGGDFTLNSAAGGGALCKAAGIDAGSGNIWD